MERLESRRLLAVLAGDFGFALGFDSNTSEVGNAVSHSTFTGNVSGSVGAISNSFPGTATISDSILSRNVSTGGYGGGIAHFGGLLVVSDSTVSDNAGTGIANNGSMTVSNSILTRNSGYAHKNDLAKAQEWYRQAEDWCQKHDHRLSSIAKNEVAAFRHEADQLLSNRVADHETLPTRKP